MTKLSVNINKIATLRNARGGNYPNVLQVALDCERFGAEGITVHPRPDERHIRYADVFELKQHIQTEFNIEGYPSEAFLEMCLKAKPAQVTLVPDAPDAITSNAGWDTVQHQAQLSKAVQLLKENNIRVSLFMDTNLSLYESAAKSGADRIELYTERYAKAYEHSREKVIIDYQKAAHLAGQLGLGVNAGHDLNSTNLQFFRQSIPNLLEVSIGHALITESLYWGLENTIQIYLRALK